MSQVHRPLPEEVDHLLRNAQLRDDLEPYFDESIRWMNGAEVPTPLENEFLASMLAWERAPVLPISRWFEPELALPAPDTLDGAQLHLTLWQTIHKLFEKRIVLDFTDHLTDRQLYCLVARDILPSPEKKIDDPHTYLHWDCADAGADCEIWLRYYATDEDRASWTAEYHEPLPPRQQPPFQRDLPREPEQQ